MLALLKHNDVFYNIFKLSFIENQLNKVNKKYSQKNICTYQFVFQYINDVKSGSRYRATIKT